MKTYNFTTANGQHVADKLYKDGFAPLFVPTSRGWEKGDKLHLTSGQHGNPKFVGDVEVVDELEWEGLNGKPVQNVYVKLIEGAN